MSVTKIFTNKKKTKIAWKTVAYIFTGLFDKFGNKIYKHHYIGCYQTEREGKEAERKFLNDFESGKIQLKGNITCKDVLLFFISYIENEGCYAKGTIINYKCLYERYIKFFDLVPVKKITKELIRNWRKFLIEKELSVYRVNDCIKLLKAAFNYAIEEKIINYNPFSDIKKETLPKKLRRRFSIDELRKILVSCQSSIPEYYCIFALSCLTGMRAGEYCALEVKDIDFKNKLIYIDKQFTRGELKNRTKTKGSTRIVHPSDMTLEIIQWHLKTFNIKEGLLFKNSIGGYISAKWVERKLKKLLELNGYQKNYVRVHDLRGQYVDLQHYVGTPTEQIAREVGHVKTSTTSDIYTQILKEIPKNANNKMDEIIFLKKEK